MMNEPKDIKAFTMRLNDDGRTVAAMDVLAPGIGEIIGGSQRLELSSRTASLKRVYARLRRAVASRSGTHVSLCL